MLMVMSAWQVPVRNEFALGAGTIRRSRVMALQLMLKQLEKSKG
jgi:hypothetical protein